jgi:hypothetical protein
MKTQQKKEVGCGVRKQVDWDEIAAACIPGYPKMRSDQRRKKARNTLRNSVFVREKQLSGDHGADLGFRHQKKKRSTNS